MWVHHKITTKDIFSIQVCAFVKTTLYVCSETIMFLKSELLLATRIWLLQSQKLMLLFDDIIPKLYGLCFLLMYMLCIFLYQLNSINCILFQETHHFHHFMCCFMIEKHNWILHYVPRGFVICNLIVCKNTNVTLLYFVHIQYITRSTYINLISSCVVADHMRLSKLDVSLFCWCNEMLYFGSKSYACDSKHSIPWYHFWVQLILFISFNADVYSW